MTYLGDVSATSIPVVESDLDINLLSDFLFQEDGMPKLAEDSAAEMNGQLTTTPSTDGTSSSDDAGVSHDSPVFAPPSNSLVQAETIDHKARRKAQVAVSAQRHRYRKKHEMLGLKKEVVDLAEQLHSLRSKHRLLRPDGAVEEYTMAQRHKRRQAEKVNEQLRRALVMQRRFFATVQGLVLGSPITNAELNMGSLLHMYTRLGRSSYSRLRDYLALCTDSKADLAVQILLRETEGMDYSGSPSMATRDVTTSNPQHQILTTVATYAFDYLDLKSVFVSACSAVLGCGTDWPEYAAVSLTGEVLDKPQGNITYAKTNTCYTSTANSENQGSDVSVESRSLVFYRMTDSYGVLVWDYADEDELHPVNPETVIKRDLVGAAMVRRELCHDGVERVVYRSICTKKHSFSLSPTLPRVSNFLQMSAEGARVCGQTVFNRIREHATLAGVVSV
ncbi:hypothetical protein PRNP1_001012 [Phytophthora ramorum]